MMTTSDRFEDRLLRELRRVVEERPQPPARRATGAADAACPGRRGRRRCDRDGRVAIVASRGDVTPIAYAVQPQANGEVSVSIHSLSDAADCRASCAQRASPRSSATPRPQHGLPRARR